eukprot:JP438155.1.p2 GENE.JP438155.1~~JP438155.1.p2  ORF type:complete len:65 (+),score=4.21 JP438155.1:184-378(+)
MYVRTVSVCECMSVCVDGACTCGGITESGVLVRPAQFGSSDLTFCVVSNFLCFNSVLVDSDAAT